MISIRLFQILDTDLDYCLFGSPGAGIGRTYKDS